MTPRNTPSLLDAVPDGIETVFHFDGEFGSASELVRGTFLGRNYGWLASERPQALRHFARIVRGDRPNARDSYAGLLRDAFGLEVAQAGDDQLADACARAVVAYLQTLRFSRDERGQFNGSSYDAFLAANRLPRGPAPEETTRNYGRRLAELIAALAHPVFIAPPDHPTSRREQPSVFGPEELRGLRIFFKAAVGSAQKGGAGNCAECHLPPQFTDFTFHNTGVAQDDYDAVHGRGAYARLVVPTLSERNGQNERWRQPTEAHPRARGELLSPVAAQHPTRADLGVWNVYANDDFPVVQPALEHALNPSGRRPREAVLLACIGGFKTSGLRGLGASAPYLHTGGAASLADVVDLYRRMSDLSRVGGVRNAPPEFFAMRLQPEDTAPLVAFLRSLDDRVP